MMIKIFISYSTADANFADKIALDLNSLGANIFYSKWEIKVGDSIVQKINDALSTYSNLVIILSKNSVKSDWVQRELNSTLMRQLQNENVKIRPVLLEDCDIPPLLSDIKYADFRHNYNEGFATLIESFQEEIDLIPYSRLIEAHLIANNLNGDIRMLAILLKRITPIPNIRLNMLDFISNNTEVSETTILDKYTSDDFIKLQIIKLLEDGLITKYAVEHVPTYKTTDVGKVILYSIYAGLNEGFMFTVCSH